MLRPEGRIAYYTIYVAPDLSAADYRRMTNFWPSAATGRRSPSDMLRSAGFHNVEETDVTKQFSVTARGWLDGRRRYYDELKQALGEETLKGKIDEGESTLEALADGLLRRSLLTARRRS